MVSYATLWTKNATDARTRREKAKAGRRKRRKKETREEGNAKAQRRKDAKGKKRKEKKGIRKEEEELGRRCPKREKAAIRDTDTYQLKVHPEPTNYSSRSPPPTLPFPTLPYPSLFLFLFLFPLRPCAFAPLRSLLFLPAFTVCADQTRMASKNEFCKRLA